MSSTFWSNTIWYILLFVTSIISIIVILYKTHNLKYTIAFLFSVLGFTFVIEAILGIGMNAYFYYPKIFSDSFLDAVFGNYFSQISISSTSILIAVFNLSYRWYFIFAIIYYLIEELFLKLRIFEQYWYKSMYTLIGFIPLFWLIKMWYGKMKNSVNYILNYLTLFLSVFASNSLSVILPQRLFGIQIFKGHFFTEISKDHTTTGLVYQFFQINILMILYKSSINRFQKGLVFVCLFIVQYLLFNAGYIYISKGWFLAVTTWDLLGCYCLIAVFHYLFSKETAALTSDSL